MNIELIKDRLSAEIRESGKTQTEIARRLNIKQCNISQYVNKKQLPTIDTFAALCELLDLDANYILGISAYEGKATI